MARFIRDEKRNYPFLWLTIGGIFAGSAAWAVYAELVTRVPWQKHQQAFFDMELEQSRQARDRAKAEWEQQIEPSLKDKLARKAELETSMRSGDYAKSRAKLDELNVKFAAAESEKTFGGSDLDEAYYYRNLAEYERDSRAVKVRRAYHEAYAAEDPGKAQKLADALYADPPEPAKAEGETDKMHHLTSEIARMKAHIEKLDEALRTGPAEAKKALAASRAAEAEVIERINVEVKHQKRVDDALAAMGKIDGPAEPTLSEKDPVKRAEERKRERERVCKGQEETRNCIQWLSLEPVDAELKSIDVEVAKRKRTLVDAELRADKAKSRAKPEFDVANIIHSIVGPFQIQQVVLSWIDADRDVDREQVDRCQTCHMGADAGTYTSAAIPKQFRTHPFRSTLFAAHPVEKFGCTSCHQGQGRATDMLSHSGWHLEEKHGKERWHFSGDHYWEDPLLPVGELTKIIVDDRDDELEVKIGKGKWEKVTIEHKSPAEHDKNSEVEEHYEGEEQLFAALQAKIAPLAEGVKDKWHAVVRRVDNRVEIGLEQNNATDVIPAKEVPAFGVRFPKAELASMLGFSAAEELVGKSPIQRASAPPSTPVRAESMATWDKDGRYHPPRGSVSLQVPDDMRNRFIESLPEVEAGCMKCHSSDVDLKARASQAKYVNAKLDYERAEAAQKEKAKSKVADGPSDMPVVPADPSSVESPTPTVSEGRALFKKLNCTGCHILDGYPWDRNAGPSLDNITAKVSPEWLLSWIRYPRGFRAKTRMPNLWPKLLDPASKRPYAEGSPEYQQWEAQMREQTVAVAAYLIERSDNPSTRPGTAKGTEPLKKDVAGYADVPGATAEKGKAIFEEYGCQGCHARTDHDTADEKLPEPWRSRERDIAPTLSNMGSKTTADWIAYWVEEPSRYWHGTKMPNLRLSREEAASVGKYIVSLKEPALEPAPVDKADVALVSDASKRAEKVACSVAGGTVMSRVECGEKTIANYGCFGCHQVAGYEKSAPIAPELGGFAKKDVTTLDFGYAIADHHLHTTETFATLKLDSPRIYRRDRIELKMGDYDLSPREIRSIVLFLKGLVNARPKTAYEPQKQPEYAAALEGRQIVDDYNCRACHVIEGRGAEIDALRQGQLSADPQARAPYLNGEGQRVQPEWLFTFLRDPGKNGIRPWLHPEWAYGNDVPRDKMALRMPTFNFTPEQVTAIVRYFASWDGQEYPYQAPKTNELTEQQKLYALTHMNAPDAANCLSCHYQGEFPVERGKAELGKMAPNFNNIPHRLRPEWVKNWLLRPQNYLPYTKMTAFWANVDREKDSSYWPSESDPFRSPPLAWTKVADFPAVTTEQQAEMVRDFLFSLPPNAAFPKPGDEASSPLVKKMPVAEMEPAKDEKADKDKKDDKKGKDKNKKTGRIDGPAHL
ncbi:MAG: c-type cytochrome [Byssovorax sp.]